MLIPAFRKFFLLFCCSVLSVSCWGQSEEFNFKVYEFEDGLSHRNVFKIQQDQLGFIWIATSSGLNRFDGQQFIPFLTTEKVNLIPDNFISDLLISDDTLIWMANKNKLSLLDPIKNSIRNIPIETDSTKSFIDRLPSGLFEDSKGGIWTPSYIAETGESFLLKANAKGELKDVFRCQGQFVDRAMVEFKGTILIADIESGLRQIDYDGKELATFRLQSPFSETNAWVTQMVVAKDGVLWALLNNGQVFFLAPDATDFKIHPITNVIYNTSSFSSLLVEENGNIWIGGVGALWLYEDYTGKSYNYDIEVKKITKNNTTYRQIFKDLSGTIWIASDYGAIQLTLSEQLFANYLNEGNENCSNGFCSMRGMAEDERGNMYFSYYNSIHFLDKRNNSLRPLFPLNDFFNFPFGLYYHKNKLYTGNGKKIDLQSFAIDTIINTDASDKGYVNKGPDGLIWWAYENQLYRYNPKNDQLTELQDVNGQLEQLKEINYFFPARDGRSIWLCTNTKGIYKYHPLDGTSSHFHADSSASPQLSHNRIIAAYESLNGQLWLATADGLNRLDLNTNSLKVYRKKQGLPNNFINGMLAEGDSCLWLSTDNGLSRFSFQEQSFINFFKQDGLSKNEFNRISFHQAKDGRMYFGGLNGINAFYPGPQFLQQKQLQNAPMLFTGFSKFDGESDSIMTKHYGLTEDQAIELSHRDKFFTFEYSLANYNNSLDVIYRYQLEGYEKEWSKPTSLNSARYNNIPAGNYTFKAQATSGKGIWNPDELALKVVVHEAYYKTWWFLSLVSFGLLTILYAFSQYRLYAIRQQQKELEAIVSARTLELESEKQKSDDLLLNILPPNIAEELKRDGKAKARRHESVTVLFSDFKSFSNIAARLEPEELVAEIDHCFKAFDEIMEMFGLEKIKTIGDAYMCVGGIDQASELSPVKVIQAALEMQSFLKARTEQKEQGDGVSFQARIGIHTGPVVSGVVGIKKFAYDIWGDTVNIASRMETYGQPNKVNISESTYQLVANHFACSPRGEINVKNVGNIEMYFVDKELQHAS